MQNIYKPLCDCLILKCLQKPFLHALNLQRWPWEALQKVAYDMHSTLLQASIGKHEGNTEELESGYVVFIWIIHGSAMK